MIGGLGAARYWILEAKRLPRDERCMEVSGRKRVELAKLLLWCAPYSITVRKAGLKLGEWWGKTV